MITAIVVAIFSLVIYLWIVHLVDKWLKSKLEKDIEKEEN
jgi:hypothetical protein